MVVIIVLAAKPFFDSYALIRFPMPLQYDIQVKSRGMDSTGSVEPW